MKSPRSFLVAALLALLSTMATGQVVTVIFDGHVAELEGDGFAKLEMADSWRGDVALQWPELVVMNGAVENYCGPAGITGNLLVAIDNQVVYSADDVTIYDACGRVIYLEPLVYAPTLAGRKWLDWYSEGGPDLPQGLAAGVQGYDWGGPDPDPVDAGSTGSGRVAWVRWGLGMAIEMQRDVGLPATAAQWLEVQRWAAVQWDRAYHAYYAEEGYRRWEAWEDPNAIMGKGYRSWGGFWTTYSSTELHGRTALSPGKYPPDEQHADIAGMVWAAAATGSWAAQTSASMLIEARFSFPPFDGGASTWSNSVRELGWVGRCIGLYYGLTGEDWCLPYIDRIDDILLTSRGDINGRFWAHRAKATPSPSGYVWLSPAIQAALVEYGTQPNDPDNWLAQTSGWQSSILGITCGNMADVMKLQKPDGWQLRRASWTEHELFVAVLVLINLRAPGYNDNDLVWGQSVAPGPDGFPLSGGYAPLVNVHHGVANNYLVGTGLVTVGFVEQFANRHPQHKDIAHVFADQWIDYLLAGGYVDGGWLKADLDRLYLSCGRRGWLFPPTP